MLLQSTIWMLMVGVAAAAGRDPCQACLNNGKCAYVGSSYECQCLEGFEGRHCQIVLLHEHFCDRSRKRRRCFCADGYQLGEDGRQCVPIVEFPCGQFLLPETRSTFQVKRCPEGECPWQVLLHLNGTSHCGGALIHPHWVITAAHCLHGHNHQNLTMLAGEVNPDWDEWTEQRIPVSTVTLHENYTRLSGNSDLGLVRLQRAVTLSRRVRPVCLPTRYLLERKLVTSFYHTVSGWSRQISGWNERGTRVLSTPVLRKLTVSLTSNKDCAAWSQLKITDNMLCTGCPHRLQESCPGNDGSPLDNFRIEFSAKYRLSFTKLQ